MSTLIKIIRNDIGDDLPLGSGQIYTDPQMVRFMERSLIKINGALATSFLVDVSGVVSPTPTNDQQDVIVLCSECVIARRELSTAARNAISAKQDENSVNTSVGLPALKQHATDICGEAKLKLNELFRELQGAGANGQIIWAGNERLFEDVDFDNTGDAQLESINIDLDGTG